MPCNVKIKTLFDSGEKNKEKRWDISIVIEKLNSTRKVENLNNGVVVKTNISKPDDEQEAILNMVKVKLE